MLVMDVLDKRMGSANAWHIRAWNVRVARFKCFLKIISGFSGLQVVDCVWLENYKLNNTCVYCALLAVVVSL